MENPFFENQALFKHLRDRSELYLQTPEKIYPWWLKTCEVNVLLLTDGALDFGPGDFGLSTFVSILKNDGRRYVTLDITIAHRGPNVGDPGVAVSKSIPNFSFTNAAHFTNTMYDEVWLFGFNSFGGLTDPELKLLSAFMNSGGGVFATGDHGELGRGLCGSVTRVRSMRRWTNSSGEVGMTDPRRNDTNRTGDAGTQFNDQSDDIPQTIQPRLYSSMVNAFWKESYPHPLLCSPLGRINVLPDHPHEGECMVPPDLTGTYIDGTPEFPLGIAPEVIATSTVPAGNTAGTKQATQAHSFGAICAYDGHRANIGRVVTDATWHHFVNVNLVGELSEPDTNVKGLGFLASAQGQAHFAQIKHYYINIAVWIARPSNHQCFNSRFIWELIFNHRVIEATMDSPALAIDKISPSLVYSIGTHATDVLGKKASQCRRLKFVFDVLSPIFPEIVEILDPWRPVPPRPEPDPPLPWFDYNPLLALALGGGLLAIRDKYMLEKKAPKKDQKNILDVFHEGAKWGAELGAKQLNSELKKLSYLGKK